MKRSPKPSRLFSAATWTAVCSSRWGMEGPGADASEQYDWLRNKLPVPIDYVVVVADSSSPRAGREQLIANLSVSVCKGITVAIISGV